MGEKLNVYVAGPFEHRDLAEEAAVQLREAGLNVVSTWHDPDSDEMGYEDEKGEARAKAFAGYAIRDLAELDRADEILLYSLPGGKGGKDFEMGYMVANGMAVSVIGPQTHVFHFLPEVRHFGSVSEYIAITL